MKTSYGLKLIAAVLALGLAAPPCAYSLFGLGKKKDKEENSRKSKRDAGPLPGMDAGSIDFKAPPKMAQEEDTVGGTQGVMAQPRMSESETAVGNFPSSGGEVPDDIVIRRGKKLEVSKPPLNIEVDPFESIRSSLDPDQALLLAESPLAVVWRRTHPEFIAHERVIQPWLTTFSDRPGVIFRPLDQLYEVLQRKLEDKEARRYQWSLTVADEEGKVFQHYEGSSDPPEELLWSGQNEQGEWMQAGSAYSPVYMFTDQGGTPYTRVGKPIRYKGIVHQERDGLHISQDSSILFGMAKTRESLEEPGGVELVRSAADLIKRRYSGTPIRVECYSASKSLAEAQCRSIEALLRAELMVLPQDISTDTLQVAYTQQRVEIILQNR